MPVAVKFSRTLYDRLGHPVADELVDWLNGMDDSCRGELRQLNEANVARFESTLDLRITELRGEMREGFAEVRGEMREGFAELRGEMHEGVAKLRGEMREGFAELRGEMGEGSAKLRGESAKLRADLGEQFVIQMRWMFGMWATLFLAIIATWFVRR